MGVDDGSRTLRDMPGPRRVVVLIDSLIGGGAERVAVEASGALDRARYEPHLLVTRHSGSLAGRVEELGLPYTILGRKRGFHPRRFERARRLVAQADLLHAHKFAGSAWGALLARSAGRPLVAHEHTFDGVTSAGRTLVLRAVIAPAASRILCVSQGVARSLAAEGVDERKLLVVPNGVTVDDSTDRLSARRELGLPAEGVVIGMVARLREEKRHELALRTLAELHARGGNEQLCLVGDGPLEAELRRSAEELGVAGSVTWAGERPNAQRLLRAFDVMLLCSSFEGMPLAALEALVSGVPLVATAVGALPELLADGGGVVSDGDSPAALADAIRAGLAAATAGDEGFAANRARFSIDRLARDLEAIYDSVLEERGGRA